MEALVGTTAEQAAPAALRILLQAAQAGQEELHMLWVDQAGQVDGVDCRLMEHYEEAPLGHQVDPEDLLGAAEVAWLAVGLDVRVEEVLR